MIFTSPAKIDDLFTLIRMLIKNWLSDTFVALNVVFNKFRKRDSYLNIFVAFGFFRLHFSRISQLDIPREPSDFWISRYFYDQRRRWKSSS